MHNTELMQVLNSLTNLISQLLNTSFCQLKATFLYVVEHIFSGHKIEHNVVRITAVKYVD